MGEGDEEEDDHERGGTKVVLSEEEVMLLQVFLFHPNPPTIPPLQPTCYLYTY